MATSISAADTLSDDFDYSISHRTPPPVPSHPPRHTKQVSLSSQQQDGDFYWSNSTYLQEQRDDAHSPKSPVPERAPRRQTSFSTFLRKTTSRSQLPGGINETEQPLPAQARTLIAQVQAEAAANRNGAGANGKMLRKGSAMRKERELELQAQEAAEREARRNQPPPQIPSLFNYYSGPSQTPSGDDPYPYTHFNHRQQPFSDEYYHAIISHDDIPNNTVMDASSSSPAYGFRSASSASPAGTSSPAEAAAQRVGGRPLDAEYVLPDHPRRSESMTHRSRYSYTGAVRGVDVTSPRRIRRRKDPTPFNILVVGAKNCGKTSFISFLRHSLALPTSKTSSTELTEKVVVNPTKSSFTSQYIETEIDGERIGLTLWDSTGLEKHIIDLQLREMSVFVESKFEETFIEEQKVMRSPGVQDTHIHCVLLILDPVRLDATVAASNASGVDGEVGGLDNDLDLEIMRALQGKTTVIPIISKADTLTTRHAAVLKRAVWESMKAAKLDPLEALELEDDLDDLPEDDEDEDSEQSGEEEGEEEETDDDDADDSNDGTVIAENGKLTDKNGTSGTTITDNTKSSDPTQVSLSSLKIVDEQETPYIPMTILSPDPYEMSFHSEPNKGSSPKQPVVGRNYPWGTADPHNPSHSDFTRLRDSVFGEWRSDLRDLARSRWYENWRTTRLEKFPPGTQKAQRVRGGVTPVGAVPRESRSGSGNGIGGVAAVAGASANGAGTGGALRNVSNGGGALSSAAVPRSVSTAAGSPATAASASPTLNSKKLAKGRGVDAASSS